MESVPIYLSKGVSIYLSAIDLEALFERPVDLVLSDTIKRRLKPVIHKEAAYA